ncbi:hypothetical protein KKB10_05520 [Patescibacteria group bacterium]|nr:hypothetical protein [Patescibacteria group bacterium]MBU1075348.1 hypothetical protein [Patescibacteria group bacterium]MBU1951719.1 hypothetical protein [Patescibacteria group bacterium]
MKNDLGSKLVLSIRDGLLIVGAFWYLWILWEKAVPLTQPFVILPGIEWQLFPAVPRAWFDFISAAILTPLLVLGILFLSTGDSKGTYFAHVAFFTIVAGLAYQFIGWIPAMVVCVLFFAWFVCSPKGSAESDPFIFPFTGCILGSGIGISVVAGFPYGIVVMTFIGVVLSLIVLRAYWLGCTRL